MKRKLAIPQLYTMAVFGISVSLMPFWSSIPLMSGTIFFMAHPIFAIALFCSLSTLIMWIATTLIFLHNSRVQRKSVTKSVNQNLALVSLVLITIIASMSGSLFLSRTIPSYYENHVEDLWSLPALRPDPVVQLLGMLYFFGTILSELGWITHALLSHSGIFGGVSLEGECRKGQPAAQGGPREWWVPCGGEAPWLFRQIPPLA